jgi:hypothetical protein
MLASSRRDSGRLRASGGCAFGWFVNTRISPVSTCVNTTLKPVCNSGEVSVVSPKDASSALDARFDE